MSTEAETPYWVLTWVREAANVLEERDEMLAMFDDCVRQAHASGLPAARIARELGKHRTTIRRILAVPVRDGGETGEIYLNDARTAAMHAQLYTDIYNHILRRVRNYGVSVAEMARQAGLHRTTLRRRLAVADLCTEDIEANAMFRDHVVFLWKTRMPPERIAAKVCVDDAMVRKIILEVAPPEPRQVHGHLRDHDPR